MRVMSAVTVLLFAMPFRSAAAQAASGTFTVTSGLDTIAVETYSAAPGKLTGFLRLPQQEAAARYVIHFRPDGSIAEADIRDDTRNFFSGTITFDEKAAVDARARGPAARFVMAPASTYPIVGTSLELMELLVRVTHATSRDSTSAQVFNIRNRILGTATIRRLPHDSLAILCVGCQRVGSRQEFRLGVAPTGDFTGGVEARQEWMITRR